MRKALTIAILLCAFSADFAHAETASCSPQTVTVSNSSPTAGDSVTLYTVTQNATSLPATHTVSFAIDTTVVGTESLELKPGEPQVASVSWTATPGDHTANASIEIQSPHGNSSGPQTTHSIKISVATLPPPSAAQQTVSQVSSAFQQGVSAATPAVLGFSNSAFKVTEKVRADAIAAVEKQLAKKDAGEVLGASDANLAAAGKAGSLFSKIWDKLLRAALFILKTQILFYGLAAVVAYLLLRLGMTWISERRRSSFANG